MLRFLFPGNFPGWSQLNLTSQDSGLLKWAGFFEGKMDKRMQELLVLI